MQKNQSKSWFLITACIPIFALLVGFSVHAYDNRCPDSAVGLTVEIEGRSVRFTNSSSECRQIGVAVYRLFSPSSREDAFYYSKTFGLQANRSATITAPVPPCAYVIDAIVGEPKLAKYSTVSYGSLKLKEEFNTSAAYCTDPNTSRSETAVLAKENDVPLPKPIASPLPLPSPILSPEPRVLGASVSSVPASIPTGADAAIPAALALGAATSGLARWASGRMRTRNKKVLH
jgi:hypothetical protein